MAHAVRCARAMLRRIGTLVSALTLLLAATTADAQTAPPPNPSVSSETPGVSSPNLAMLATGLMTLLVSYVPAAVVAGESNQSADANLFIPVAGPWLDIGDRPPCGPRQVVSCRVETGNVVMLAVDGVFQTWGLAAAIGSFFAHDFARPSVRVRPSKVGMEGYGMAAVGSF